MLTTNNRQTKTVKIATRRSSNKNEWTSGQPAEFVANQEVRWMRNESSQREGRIGQVLELNLIVFDADQKRHTIKKAEAMQWRPA